jgi:isoquinoline 1-oxidoreductase beta subunit
VRALAPKFEDTGKGAETSETIYGAIGAVLDREKGDKVFSSGKGSDALQGAAKLVEAEYRVPFLAHATMEPMNATARIADGRCEVWTGVQDPLAARKVASEASGLKPEQVTIHNQQLGGGFGRRRAHCQRDSASSGEADLESRRRHPARLLSAGRRRSLQGGAH